MAWSTWLKVSFDEPCRWYSAHPRSLGLSMFINATVCTCLCPLMTFRISVKNVHTFLTDIRKVIKGHKQVQTVALINMLNPKLRGWALYHRHGSSKETLSHVDHAIFQTLWQWAKRRHPRKGKQWIKDRYFKRVGNRSWSFSGTAKDPGGKSARFRFQLTVSANLWR